MVQEFLDTSRLNTLDKKNEKIIDLCYEEDSNAKVDMNVIVTDEGEFVEVQGTGEEAKKKR